MELNINSRLYKDIIDYCQVNDIQDIDKEINRLLRIGLNVDKFGMGPFTPPPSIEEPLIEEKVEIVEPKPKRQYTRKPKVEKQVENTEIETPLVEEPKPKKKVRIIKN